MPTENEIVVLRAARATGIRSRDELANFMAQVSHESGGLTRMEESFRYTRGIDQISVQSAFREGREALEMARREALDGRPRELARLMYGGRMGNDDEGDGYLYRGRGFTQLTGEDNYRAAGTALDLDLVGNPGLAVERDNAARIAVWYWQDRVPRADRDDVSAATLAINGGYNGLADRHDRFDAWHAQLTPQFLIDLDAGHVRPGAGVAPAAGRPAMADGALRRFESGVEVERLQADLRALGVRDARGREVGIDGEYGVGTEQAVRRFQEDHGMPVTGRADPATLMAVQEALQRQPQLPPEVPVPPRDAIEREGGARELRAEMVGHVSGNSHACALSQARVAHDPRDPGHLDHAMCQEVRARLHALYAAHGLAHCDPQIERATACVMADARQSGMTRITLLDFGEDYTTGKRNPNGNLIAWEGDPTHPATRYSTTDTQLAAATEPEVSYRRFEEASQRWTQAEDHLLTQAQARDIHDAPSRTV